ncbi:carbon-nitrogen hydrolase family protein [Arthrobacter sp. Soc17.1.1.1]|uniref:carbon-nitrogen hydrolase family protein n=1 Tax=Arthrobacter sp. Soc17.1.1.1 TaxID=3121277 RepID=UPI002FE47EF3
MLVSVGQFRPGGDVPANLAVMRELAAEASSEGSALIVFPEESMLSIGQVEGPLRQAVEATWTSFVQQLSFIAAEHSLGIIAGGYEPSGEERPFNTLVLIDATGRIVDTYRKLHLYDAFSYQESTRIKPGDGGITIAEIGDVRVGLMTCYDLRFPEQARALADAGADLLCVPASWFKGEHKIEHWETLLKARAIENTLWVAAAGTSSSHTIGHSAILDPMGIPQVHLDDEERGVVTTEVSRRRVDDVREFLPVLRNRRFGRNDTIVDAH